MAIKSAKVTVAGGYGVISYTYCSVRFCLF